MADVVKVVHGNGDVSIGVEDDGVFIPLASASASRIAGLKERASSLSERLEADPEDKAVASAIDSIPISAKKAAASKAKANDDEDEGES